MKISKEILFVIICGLFLLAYVLEAVVNPLKIKLPSPYGFITDGYYLKYPFTAVVVGIRGLAIFLIPLFLYSFFSGAYYIKATISLVLAGLMQLYSLQEVATGTTITPLEWSLSLSIAGIAILLPTIYYFCLGLLRNMKNWINSWGDDPVETDDET